MGAVAPVFVERLLAATNANGLNMSTRDDARNELGVILLKWEFSIAWLLSPC
jgi:hypothetical protein